MWCNSSPQQRRLCYGESCVSFRLSSEMSRSEKTEYTGHFLGPLSPSAKQAHVMCGPSRTCRHCCSMRDGDIFTASRDLPKTVSRGRTTFRELLTCCTHFSGPWLTPASALHRNLTRSIPQILDAHLTCRLPCWREPTLVLRSERSTRSPLRYFPLRTVR